MTIPRLHASDRTPDALRGAIIALGNFDGFHLGHQAVAGEAIAWARAEGRPAIIATFDPHPVRFFKPDAEPFRLTTLDQRQELFAAAGADAMLVFAFDAELASTTAEDFMAKLLVERLGAAGVVTGEDFTFGRARGGNIELLKTRGAELGLSSRAVGAVMLDGEVVSSSRIREALKAGDCETATRLLSRPFAIRGIVQHGDKVGRTIGFPTANIDHHALAAVPADGVYAGRAVLDGVRHPAAISVGTNPTFDGSRRTVEAYLLDVDQDLYGRLMRVEFVERLRDTLAFDSVDDLVAQMHEDVAVTRRIVG